MFYRLLVHLLPQLEPPRSIRDQRLVTQKAHANKLFSLEEDSLTSLREASNYGVSAAFIELWPYRIPSYQETAVNNFLTNHKPPFTSAQFNTSGVRTYSLGIFSP